MDARRSTTKGFPTQLLMAALVLQAFLALVFRGNVAFAAILGLVAVKLRSDRAWLLVPIIANGISLLTVLAETIVRKPGAGPALARPFLTIGAFLLVYAIGYVRLGGPATDGPQRGNRGLGWRFDKWSGR